MPRAVSIHIGVNQPRDHEVLLRRSEDAAWGMAELARQAGYDRILVLRGSEATRQAVHDALAGAAGTLQGGDTLLVSFSGHGGHALDRDGDERHGCDESWCLHDGSLLDDKLAGYWRLFEPGARIVVVSESCYSGGIGRTGHGFAYPAGRPAHPPVMRGGVRGGFRGPRPATIPGTSCIGEPPRDADEIRASVLLLTASAEEQTAEEGLFTDCLLGVWAKGTFDGSYCALYLEVRGRVMAKNPRQEPQILMLGRPDEVFPTLPAFHRGAAPPPEPRVVYRGQI